MKNLLKLSLALAFFAAPALHASCPSFNPNCANATVPEIDPSLGAGALALVTGMTVVIRSRRKA